MSIVMPIHLTPAFSVLPAFVPESLPRAELPAHNNSSPLTCYPNSQFFTGSDTLPAPLSPINPVSPSPSPLDLSSSPSGSSSSSSSEEEEDGERSSDPPSPDIIQHVYHCLHCSNSYGSLSALSHHQLSHFPQNQRASSLPTEVSTRPAFHCKHCPKEYTSLGALKMHIRSHTLPCVCPTCGKAFSRPWLLRGHIRTHTGMNPLTQAIVWISNPACKCNSRSHLCAYWYSWMRPDAGANVIARQSDLRAASVAHKREPLA